MTAAEWTPASAGVRPLEWHAVLFDCDGVLVDSEPIANLVLAEMLSALGLPYTAERSVERFVGRSMSACMKIIREELGEPVPESFAEEYQRRTFAAFAERLEPVPGVVQVLDSLPWRTCVASSGDHEKLRTTLARTGLYARFHGRIFSATEVPRGKPHPDLFLHAAERMGAIPAHCAVVEDSVFGVEAGRAAGMTVFGYTGTFGGAALAARGAVVFDRMTELPELLERHRPRRAGS